MNTASSHPPNKFNPNGPVAYFITFHTYGTWLHGDENGSVDKNDDNKPGTPVISPNPDLMKFKRLRMKYPPVTLTYKQRKSIDSTISNVSAYNNWKLHAVSARTEHIHVVISALKSPEAVMNSLKSWCTRKMREQGLWIHDNSPWSFHGSTRYIWNEESLQRVCNYVLYCQD